jgi:hypothetical protein
MNLLLVEGKQGMTCIFLGISPAFSKRKDGHFQALVSSCKALARTVVASRQGSLCQATRSSESVEKETVK